MKNSRTILAALGLIVGCYLHQYLNGQDWPEAIKRSYLGCIGILAVWMAHKL